MLCACSGEQFKLEEAVPQSPESLATRDFSASGLSSRTGTVDWESKLEDAQVDEAESTLKEALSLNYEEARALLGRLEYQRGNFDAALQVFQGIDIRLLSPRMSKAIAERTQPRKLRSRARSVLPGVMSLHSVSLLLEAILLKANSLAELGRVKEAARECQIILDTVESALPNGIYNEINEDSKLLEMFHRALELLPKLWLQAGSLDEAIAAYRRALLKPWNLDPKRLAKVQKDLAATLLYGGVETSIPSQYQPWGSNFPKSSTEESILLLFILMQKVLYGEMEWDQEVMDLLTFALAICGQFESLADHVEQLLPGIYKRGDRWYFLALCYSAAGQNETALNLLKKVSGFSEDNQKPHLASFLLGAKLCAQDPNESSQGIEFAHRVIDISIGQNEHILSQAHKFLGVCYGNAARMSISDFERVTLHRESLNSLNRTCAIKDQEISFRLGLENAIQRNLNSAFEQVLTYSKTTAGSSTIGWKLLALIASADQRLKDAEAIIDLAIDETGSIDQLELLQLKAAVKIAQEQPKQAIETYRILLSLIQGLSEKHDKNANEVEAERRLELEAWLDLAGLYSDHELWVDSDICIKKAKAAKFYSPRCWHATGRLFEAQELYKEAIVAFSVSLSIEPDYVPSIVSTAKVLVKMGNKSIPIAKSFLMNALRLEPTNHDAWLNLGLIYKMEGLMQQAADSFQAAHELKLSSPVQSFQRQ
ncbi:putative calmodulin-binding protein [Handroanthus impetiginosus]|uniref:Putative calmodulin-binding protein n=1 Tax=Handroanthus impetiginosus TaxID=429701 RepID=A0A2G9GIN6_9LAMI|nr:putative calmodulin-binding protein [Handroanthus impetiginosus]